jgi:hypothetical protein
VKRADPACGFIKQVMIAGAADHDFDHAMIGPRRCLEPAERPGFPVWRKTPVALCFTEQVDDLGLGHGCSHQQRSMAAGWVGFEAQRRCRQLCRQCPQLGHLR